MRFSKKNIIAGCARVLPALASALPSEGSLSKAAPAEQLLDFELHDNYAQATFEVPCAGCLGTSHDDESIILSVEAYTNGKDCGGNVTLNGAYLPHEWNGDISHGSGSYSGVTDIKENAWFLQHDLDLEWESACLHGEEETDDAAQVLTVNIKAIDGKALASPYPGFTLSYKHASPPELLRLQPTPDSSVSVRENSESWRHPPTALRLVLPKDELKTTGYHSKPQLEDDLRELRHLEAEAQKLQKVIAAKKKHIELQGKKEVESFREELRNCANISCALKTIAHGAHGAWGVLYIHFHPNHPHHHHGPPLPPPPMGHPGDDAYHQVWRAGKHKQGNMKIASDAAIASDDTPPPPSPAHDAPSPQRHGPPHRPGPRMQPHESAFVVALEIVIGILCCGCICTAIRNRCCSARSKVERAAAREERRTRKEYQRAARKHAWAKWWHGNWRRHDLARIEDYEEKQSLIQHQEGVLEDVMQEEIRQLRAAHGVVNDLVSQAEEGRVVAYPHNYHNYPQAPYSPLSTASTYPPTSISELPSRPLSRTDSLPGYRSDTSSRGAPPAYEEDEDVSDSVANGFQHHYSTSTRSEASSRWTPDSSVVDVSPRPSAETLRYPDITEAEEFAEEMETGVGDVKN